MKLDNESKNSIALKVAQHITLDVIFEEIWFWLGHDHLSGSYEKSDVPEIEELVYMKFAELMAEKYTSKKFVVPALFDTDVALLDAIDKQALMSDDDISGPVTQEELDEANREWGRSLDVPTQDEVFEYLDELRDSGVTNMYGAASYIVQEFDVYTLKEARELLIKWMDTYSERHSGDNL